MTLRRRNTLPRKSYLLTCHRFFALIRAILVLQPQSVVQVNPFVSEHFIVASDASQDSLDKEKQAFCLPVEWGRSLVLPS